LSIGGGPISESEESGAVTIEEVRHFLGLKPTVTAYLVTVLSRHSA
jgi:hypothetical protein